VCEEKNSTWKKNMEDVTIFHEGYGGKEGTSFFGVFDGFHGQISAVTASREMPVLVLEQLSKQDPLLSLEKDQVKLLSRFEALFQKDYNRPYPGQAQNIGLGLGPEQLENLTNIEQVNLAFTTAFWKMDRVLGLGKDETAKIRWSGCTALLCPNDSGLPSSDEKEQGTGQESNIPTPSQELQGGRIIIADCGQYFTSILILANMIQNRSYSLNTIHFQLTSLVDSDFTGKVHAVLYKQGSGFRLTKAPPAQ
jgi:hypothetical protein